MPKPVLTNKIASKPVRSFWTPRNLFGRLLSRVAMMFIVLGIASPFLAETNRKFKWEVAVGMVGFGVLLAFVASRVVKKRDEAPGKSPSRTKTR